MITLGSDQLRRAAPVLQRRGAGSHCRVGRRSPGSPRRSRPRQGCVGVEDTSPDESGEICIAELYGHAVGPGGSTVRSRSRRTTTPGLTTDTADVALDIHATGWHSCAAARTADETRFLVDDEVVRVVPQGLAHPLQPMIDLFEFPARPDREPPAYPKTAGVGAVRGYRSC